MCIWIACSRSVTLRASVFRTTDLRNIKSTKEAFDGKDSNIIGFGTAESIKLGDHLHIGLVTAHPIVTSTDSDAFQDELL